MNRTCLTSAGSLQDLDGPSTLSGHLVERKALPRNHVPRPISWPINYLPCLSFRFNCSLSAEMTLLMPERGLRPEWIDFCFLRSRSHNPSPSESSRGSGWFFTQTLQLSSSSNVFWPSLKAAVCRTSRAFYLKKQHNMRLFNYGGL